MTLNANILHQRVDNIVKHHADDLGPGPGHRHRTQAFTALVVAAVLDVPLEEAFHYLTDGGQDGGIDAISISGAQAGEFTVTLVQTKYKQRLDGEAKFPANEFPKLVMTIRGLFDPDASLELHPAIQPRIEEIRGLIGDGYIPHVRVILANNGQRWGSDGDQHIETAGLPADQVRWEHLNHDRLVQLMRAPKVVNDEMQLQGDALVESFDFCRVLVGKVSVAELARMFDEHGDALLDRNVRRYLGLRSNRVNRGIADTLRNPSDRTRFYFYNNGVTVVCSKFRHNALQRGNFRVKLDELQVVNGGQTCHTIRRTLADLPDEDFSSTYVLLRIYELDQDQRDLVHHITYATNSQNPVDLQDLRANDETQRSLELGLKQLGYTYVRVRGVGGNGKTITPAKAAEAVLAIWRRKPHVARSGPEALFGRYYQEVFSDSLTPQQVVTAVQLLSLVQKRTRSEASSLPRFAAYAPHFLAMLIGETLGAVDEPISGATIDPYFQQALLKCRLTLALMGIDEENDSLQRLSGTFRRGDLVQRVASAERDARALARQSQEQRQLLAKIFVKLDEVSDAQSTGNESLNEIVAKYESEPASEARRAELLGHLEDFSHLSQGVQRSLNEALKLMKERDRNDFIVELVEQLDNLRASS